MLAPVLFAMRPSRREFEVLARGVGSDQPGKFPCLFKRLITKRIVKAESAPSAIVPRDLCWIVEAEPAEPTMLKLNWFDKYDARAERGQIVQSDAVICVGCPPPRRDPKLNARSLTPSDLHFAGVQYGHTPSPRALSSPLPSFPCTEVVSIC